MTRKARAWLVGAAAAVLALPTAQIAGAEEPLDLDAQVTDDVGAIGEQGVEVQAAIDQLFADHGQRLYVVFVDTFSGWDAQEWADETSTRNQFTANDALLAVATTERVYALSVDPDFPLSRWRCADVEEVAGCRAGGRAGAAAAHRVGSAGAGHRE